MQSALAEAWERSPPPNAVAARREARASYRNVTSVHRQPGRRRAALAEFCNAQNHLQDLRAAPRRQYDRPAWRGIFMRFL
jgi:hypothetical protein